MSAPEPTTRPSVQITREDLTLGGVALLLVGCGLLAWLDLRLAWFSIGHLIVAIGGSIYMIGLAVGLQRLDQLVREAGSFSRFLVQRLRSRPISLVLGSLQHLVFVATLLTLVVDEEAEYQPLVFLLITINITTSWLDGREQRRLELSTAALPAASEK